MIPQQTLERLQAGAIILPEKPVAITVGTCTVLVRVVPPLELMRMEALVDQSNDGAESATSAIRSMIETLVVKASGAESIDGDPVSIDLAAEPRLMSVEFWGEVIADACTLSRLNRGLVGKSEPQSASSTGSVTSTVAAAESATSVESKTPKAANG